MLSLATLRQVLSPLKKVGKEELSFEVEGVHITIRSLLPWEEVAVHRHGVAVLDENREFDGTPEDDGMSKPSAIDYFDRFRIEVIAHAIIQIDSLDLRDVTVIPTGDELPDGKPITKAKPVVLRDIIRTEWSRTMISLAFAKYGELVQKLQDSADDLASRSIQDLDAELERLTKRIEETKNERELRLAGDPTIHRKQVEGMLNAEQVLEQQNREAMQAMDNQRRRSVIPDIVPPPGPAQSSSAPMQMDPLDNGLANGRLPPQELSPRRSVPKNGK